MTVVSMIVQSRGIQYSIRALANRSGVGRTFRRPPLCKLATLIGDLDRLQKARLFSRLRQLLERVRDLQQRGFAPGTPEKEMPTGKPQRFPAVTLMLG